MKMNKQGSALLIVLGFLSFMVVSAVAFAIYMRAERQPSSALRRSVATRHLVKAALAEAISRVDDAVRDDPFPGLCATNSNGDVADANLFYHFSDDRNQAVDVWMGRVFMPPDAQGGTTSGKTRTAPVSETVSVLNLEALGYLPPPLVNDVRFLSRSSWAASWQQLPFDTGRFAYCAVNVSDYLDVNRISAGKPRTAEPQRRLSLAHLFDPNFDPTDIGAGTSYNGSSVGKPNESEMQAFDKMTGKDTPATGYVPGDSVGGTYEKWNPIGNNAPYVSMLDYNLAIKAGGEPFTPLFYNWLANVNLGNGSYYEFGDAKMKSAARQPFVTESWSTNETWRVDLATLEGQPFYPNGLDTLVKSTEGETTYTKLRQKIKAGDNFLHLMGEAGAQVLGDADYATLYDYLDHDDVPLSLALPSVECVPMIAGLTPPQFEMTAIKGNGDDNSKVWSFNAQDWFKEHMGRMQVLIPYPFKRVNANDRGGPSTYYAQVLVRIVLAPAGADRTKLAARVRPTKEIWQGDLGFRMEDAAQFSFIGLSEPKSFSIPSTVTEEDDAAVSGSGGKGLVNFLFGDFKGGGNLGEVKVLQMEKTTETVQGPFGPEKKSTTTYTVLASPLNAEGGVAIPPGTQYKEEDTASPFDTAELKAPYVPHAFVWVRILDGANPRSDKTVDLVPAGPTDDRINEKNDDPMLTVLSSLTGEVSPVFQFISTEEQNQQKAFSFKGVKDETFGGGGAVEWNVKSLYAVDPRFNAAPEHWYTTQDQDVSFDKWLSNTKSARQNVADRDPDIFMFTSNQGFLQSLGEVAFLPRLHVPGTGAAFGLESVDTLGQGTFGTSAENVLKAFSYLWRTYDLADLREFYARSAQFGIGRTQQRECLVNPHTDNLGVMMAALANTPYDYWAAAAGVDENSELFKNLGNTNTKGLNTFSDTKNYAFNENSGNSKIGYRELVQVAKTIMGVMGGVNLNTGDSAVLQSIQDVVDGAGAGNVHEAVARALKTEIRANRARPSNAWQTLWDEMWGVLALNKQDLKNDPNLFDDLLGVQIQGQPLHYVDRKFLYSYWRDCFANNQQLFLIFVRAESSALGGPGEGTPGQLGGRAVALVWRDPDWSETGTTRRDNENVLEGGDVEKSRPHRTRVLFYHQFD